MGKNKKRNYYPRCNSTWCTVGHGPEISCMRARERADRRARDRYNGGWDTSNKNTPW